VVGGGRWEVGDPRGSRQTFKWPVAVERRINAAPSDVWSVISNPGNLETCHPFCRRNPVESWPGVGSRDSIEYHSGWLLERHFTDWIDGVGYDLEIGRKGGRRSAVSWRIRGVDDGTSVFGITIYPVGLQHLPVLIRWVPHLVTMRPMLRSYLESVLRGFEHYITTGQPVRRNQFGPHPWFSPTENEA
jgi:hypothetical protein